MNTYSIRRKIFDVSIISPAASVDSSSECFICCVCVYCIGPDVGNGGGCGVMSLPLYNSSNTC